ncbi:MAG: VOC family protein [Propionibacteriaceae bacterium]|jgi:PhnB protein|nr:VOC family protein [Propionibacteriaceae bacterium]
MIQPFITFEGQAAAAMDFYERVFDGTNKQIMRWSDLPPNPEAPPPEKMSDQVLYGRMTICGTDVNFSDTDPDFHAPEVFAQSCFISLALHFESEKELRATYAALSEGGTVLMEIAPQFFAEWYAWVQDKFGVTWQLICDG